MVAAVSWISTAGRVHARDALTSASESGIKIRSVARRHRGRCLAIRPAVMPPEEETRVPSLSALIIGAAIVIGMIAAFALCIWGLVLLDTRDWPNPGADEDR